MKTILILALLTGLVSSSSAAEPSRLEYLEKLRVRLKVSGALTLGLGLATAVAGSLVVGISGLCGTEFGACQKPSTIATFDAGLSLVGLGGGATIAGIVLLARSHHYRVERDRLRAGLAFIPSLALVRTDHGVDGAFATWSLRF